VQVSDWYQARVPDDLVCFWDFDEPSIPHTARDTSATAITAAAWAKLAPLARDRYREPPPGL
jgi:unsaturated chondroitin disaccharide hydrolase